MKDAMMAANFVTAFVAGVVALWEGIEVVCWIFGGDLANPEYSVGVLLVGLAVLTFGVLNVRAIFEEWPGK